MGIASRDVTVSKGDTVESLAQVAIQDDGCLNGPEWNYEGVGEWIRQDFHAGVSISRPAICTLVRERITFSFHLESGESRLGGRYALPANLERVLGVVL